MDRNGHEKPRFPDPNRDGPADAEPNMNPQDHGPRVRKFQDPGAAIEALVRWDELGEADLLELEADPHLGPRLATLRAPLHREPPALAPILELGCRARRRRIQRVALACAATLVVGFSLWMLVDGRESRLQLPAAPLLRGESELALYYPRGPVLERGSWMPAAGLPLRFELRPVEGAQSYRVEVLSHAGGAFDSGSKVTELRGALAELVLPARLEAGSYTWRAYASVGGLERDLGARDFEVRADPELLKRLSSAAGSSALERDCERIRILHESGDWTDARECARTLPPSAERDRYLGQVPGR
jgi:hypothetical protein